jgi:hypothetical protein
MALRREGLHGKIAFAEQVNLIGQDANVISNIELTAGKPQNVHTLVGVRSGLLGSEF